ANLAAGSYVCQDARQTIGHRLSGGIAEAFLDCGRKDKQVPLLKHRLDISDPTDKPDDVIKYPFIPGQLLQGGFQFASAQQFAAQWKTLAMKLADGTNECRMVFDGIQSSNHAQSQRLTLVSQRDWGCWKAYAVERDVQGKAPIVWMGLQAS